MSREGKENKGTGKVSEMSDTRGVLSLISLTKKANKSVSGEFAVENAVKSGKAQLVLIASDASDNTKKKFRDMTNYRDIPMMFFSDKDSIGKALGKDTRASVAITDPGFASTLKKKLAFADDRR